MLVLACGVLAVLSPLLVGGDLRRLSLVRLRMIWLPALALVAQVVIISVVPGANHSVLVAIHLATYVAAGVFVAVNWRVPGLVLIALGGALNGITIALNGGTLPASLNALKVAGLPVTESDFMNSGVLAHPVLPILGDIFAWPSPMPLHNVFSVGDVVIVLGVAFGAHKIAGSRLVSTPWSPDTGHSRHAKGSAVAAPPRVPGVNGSDGSESATYDDRSTSLATTGFAPLGSLSPLQQRLAALRPGASPEASGVAVSPNR